MTKAAELQDRQRAIYDAVAAYWREHGMGPSYQEITELCSISSRSLTATAIDVLVTRGLLTRKSGIIRSLRVAHDWPKDPPAPNLWALFCYGQHGRIDAVIMTWQTDRSTADGSADRQVLTCPSCGGSAGLELIR